MPVGSVVAGPAEQEGLHDAGLVEPGAAGLDLSGLRTIVSLHQAGSRSLIVDTADGRRLRVSVSRSSDSGRFVAAYESLGAMSWNGKEIPVWRLTESYRASGVTIEECLEAGVAAIQAGPRAPEPDASEPAEPEQSGDEESVTGQERSAGKARFPLRRAARSVR